MDAQNTNENLENSFLQDSITNAHQDKCAPDKRAPEQMRAYNWAEQISYKLGWAKDMMKTTVTFRICSAYNQSLLFTFCNLRRHFSDLKFVIDDSK